MGVLRTGCSDLVSSGWWVLDLVGTGWNVGLACVRIGRKIKALDAGFSATEEAGDLSTPAFLIDTPVMLRYILSKDELLHEYRLEVFMGGVV